MILSFYTRQRSPWVWVQWAHQGGKRVCERTALRKDDPELERKTALLRLDWQRKILLVSGNAHAVVGMSAAGADQEFLAADGAKRGEKIASRLASGRQGWAWVVHYLATRYRARVKSRAIYEIQWRHLFEFFAGRGVGSPAEVSREHCFEYVRWRTSQVKQKSGRSPKINTAIGELKLLRLVMNEAVARGMAVENPALKLAIEAEEAEPKPDITDEEAALIYERLAVEPAWMQRSFFLAFNTGLRFATTRLHRSQVFWERGHIVIERPKGGRRREFAIEIYPAIEPLLKSWKKSGEEWLWTAPAGSKPIGIYWTEFFRKVGLPHLCFHCTRVAFISRGARNGVPESAMMQMVNHARSEIHRIYQRWRPARFREFATKISASVAAPAFAGGATADNRRRRKSGPSSGSPER